MALPSNPLTPEVKDEIQQLVKAVLATFTTQYTKHYALALTAQLEEEASNPAPKFKLMEREPPTDDRKTGLLTKEGALRKNWKKRWFVVKHNLVVEYWADEKTAQKPKAKPKGVMTLAGYRVIDDLENTLLGRLKKLASQMGVDESQLPKPKQYPPFTFEVHHDRRRCWFIQAANEEEFKEWVNEFKHVCYWSYGLTNQDPVHVAAFRAACRETRWDLGRWGYWAGGGSEQQILSDIISDELDWQVLHKVYGKLTGSWTLRNAARNQCLKFVDTVVSAGVAPAWKAMSTAVEELRPKIEPEIKKLVDPLAEAKNKIIEKMKEAVLDIINPLIAEHVTPHLQKLIDILTSPMTEAWDECISLFENKVDDWKKDADLKNLNFADLDRFGRYWWSTHTARSKVYACYDPLWDLRSIFSDIHPYSLVSDAYHDLYKKTDNAVYTFEEKLKEELEKNPTEDKAIIDTYKAKIVKKFKKDASKSARLWYLNVIKTIVMTPFNGVVVPAVKDVLTPLQEMIPEPMQQFIDILKMFDKLLNDIIDGAINALLKDTM